MSRHRIEGRRCGAGRRLGLVLPILVAGCGGAASSSATPSPTPVPQSATPHAMCPFSDGGSCLGPLAAGTYTTAQFHPALTYRVPSGWSNDEDLAGNVLLLPPGNSLPNLNNITGDFIGIAASAAAEAQDCSGHPAAGVGSSASEIIMWMRQNPGLTTSGQQHVTVGGLRGQVLDIRMTIGGTHACRSSGGSEPEVPLVVGTGTSNFNHGITAGVAERLYLLDFSGAALSIEIVDTSGGAHLDAYSAIVNGLQFAT